MKRMKKLKRAGRAGRSWGLSLEAASCDAPTCRCGLPAIVKLADRRDYYEPGPNWKTKRPKVDFAGGATQTFGCGAYLLSHLGAMLHALLLVEYAPGWE